MIDKTSASFASGTMQMLSPGQSAAQGSPSPKRLVFVKNDRMGGLVPKWIEQEAKTTQTPFETLLQANTQRTEAATSSLGFNNNVTEESSSAPPAADQQENSDAFGFFDILDMANPLQHIPIVNSAYRSISGDEIKPISQMVGSALLIGPTALAFELVDFVFAQETGKGIGRSIYEGVAQGKAPEFRSQNNLIYSNYQYDHERTANTSASARETTLQSLLSAPDTSKV